MITIIVIFVSFDVQLLNGLNIQIGVLPLFHHQEIFVVETLRGALQSESDASAAAAAGNAARQRAGAGDTSRFRGRRNQAMNRH